MHLYLYFRFMASVAVANAAAQATTNRVDRLQATLDETCPTYDCSEVKFSTFDCSLEQYEQPVDTVIDPEIVETKMKHIMRCVCCYGVGVSELLGGSANTTCVDALSTLMESYENSDRNTTHRLSFSTLAVVVMLLSSIVNI